MLNILWGCVDSDWAGDTDTRRSHTGYVLMFNGGAVSWKSRRQDSVSLSTSEAEFVAASQCGQEVLYLREILLDFHQPQTSPTTVYEDNLACITMSENAVRRKYSRHIDIRRYFVRELVAGGVLKLVPYSPYDGRCADQRPPYSSTCSTSSRYDGPCSFFRSCFPRANRSILDFCLLYFLPNARFFSTNRPLFKGESDNLFSLRQIAVAGPQTMSRFRP